MEKTGPGAFSVRFSGADRPKRSRFDGAYGERTVSAGAGDHG